jgi:transposase-like protein
VLTKYKQSASRLSEWLAANIREGLTVFAFPAAFRCLLRTTNGAEWLHREVRRRARIVSIFPNSAACLRLVSAILAEISEERLTGRTFINFEGATQQTQQGSCDSIYRKILAQSLILF